jgi:hypothetical protein
MTWNELLIAMKPLLLQSIASTPYKFFISYAWESDPQINHWYL